MILIQPCVFCGHADPEINLELGKAWVSCPVCDACGPTAIGDETAAMILWNTRQPAPSGNGEIHVHVDGAIAKTNGLLLDSLFEKGAPFEGRCRECLNIGHTVIHYRGQVIGKAPCANGCPERADPSSPAHPIGEAAESVPALTAHTASFDPKQSKFIGQLGGMKIYENHTVPDHYGVYIAPEKCPHCDAESKGWARIDHIRHTCKPAATGKEGMQ